ncbi:MAG: hypothetical protein KAU17_02280 [Spirochaetales bacterium]|nr:hypothetical protein [Spirochaetales bacterium]
MEKTITRIYTFFSILLFVLLSSFFIFTSLLDRTRGIDWADRNFLELKNLVTSVLLTPGGIQQETFSDTVTTFMRRNPRLRGILLLSGDNQLEYLRFEDESYLGNISADRLSFPVEYVYDDLFETNLTITYSPVPDTQLTLDAIYTILTKEEIILRMKRILLFLLIYMAFTVVLITLLPSFRRLDNQERTSSHISKGKNYNKVDYTGTPGDEEERLTFELERSASFDQDLVYAIVTIESGKIATQRLSSVVHTSFPFRDLTFQHGSLAYSVILPNMDLYQGIRKLESFREKLTVHDSSLRIAIGLSSRNGRLMRGSQLIKEARASLKKSEQATSNRIIGFRSDPAKYREYLAHKT